MTSLSSRQTKIQQDKLQIWSKKLTTKQSIIKTNKNLKSLKFLGSLSHSCSLPLLFFLSIVARPGCLAQAVKLPFLRSKSSDLKTLRSEDNCANCLLFFFFFFFRCYCAMF